MASSNRHWPSMFKSKPSCNPHHQWQHDINSSLIPTHRTTPYSSGCEERSPEPKPRWNPKPEQIRILEGIFNSGMVNPPRDEIRKIRAQLQEYGQVGDANVFYWFQNRKSRSKHKLRQLHNSSSKNNKQQQQEQHNMVSSGNGVVISHPQISTTVAPTSSSSSSEKSSPKETLPTKAAFSNVVSDAVPNSPTASVNQTYFHSHINDTTAEAEAEAEALFFPVQPQHHGHQGFFFSELSNVFQAAHHQHNNVGPCTSLLLSEIMTHAHSKKDHHQEHDKSLKTLHHPPPHLTFSVAPPTTPSHTAATLVPPLITHQLQGVGGGGLAAKSTVLINDVAFEVAVGPFNVREAFGEDAVLIHPTGQPVLTNQWGITLHSLQHGASYYLI